ncbi:glycosyltransferase family 4 protein [Sphingobium phenoxybenzoativorans]|uniref:glycosyltransferase family 4 protein n=1 Tax=Sphingobium phenoxybenzoativorans TaxID=1592790 RepID=UPI0009F20D79|nr:glycosyltransferase family 4 protein [Sphingobium phenoxybenzoativorans]
MHRDPRLVIMPFTGKRLGGSHISGLVLADGLRQRFDLNSVIVAPEKSEVTDFARGMGFTTIDSGAAPSNRAYDPLGALLGFRSRYSMLSRLKDGAVLHVNDMSALPIWGPAARLIGIPVIHHDRANGRKFPKCLAIQIAEHVISISSFCYASLACVGEHRKTLVTDPFKYPDTPPPSELKNAILQEMGANDDCILIGFSGNFWERKRPVFFLETARILAARNPRLRFVIFGRPGDISEARMQDLIQQMQLGAVCLLAGFRTPADNNIAALDILAMPAITEPFGRTPVEALLLGVPYVATDDAGHSEILEKWAGGVGVPLNADPEEFANVIERMITSTDQIALSLDDRRLIATELSPTSHAEAVMQVYRKFGDRFARGEMSGSETGHSPGAV